MNMPEVVVTAAVGLANAAATWTIAEQATSTLTENTFIPLGAAFAVLGASVAATYKLTKWIAAKEAREKEREKEIDELAKRIEKLEASADD